MTDPLFFLQTTQFFSSIFSDALWDFIEIFFGGFVFVACIIQRININSFKTKEELYFLDYSITKLGQFGLLLQMFLGILAFVHGWVNFYGLTTNPFIGLWCFSTACIKSKDLMVFFRKS